MIHDPVKRSRVKRALLIIIFVTIPLYVLGAIVLLVNAGIRGHSTMTPTHTAVGGITNEPPTVTPTSTLPVPTAIFPTHTGTFTPTTTLTPTKTRTYVIPTAKPSKTPTITDTPPPTLQPSDTATPVLENTAVIIPTETSTP